MSRTHPEVGILLALATVVSIGYVAVANIWHYAQTWDDSHQTWKQVTVVGSGGTLWGVLVVLPLAVTAFVAVLLFLRPSKRSYIILAWAVTALLGIAGIAGTVTFGVFFPAVLVAVLLSVAIGERHNWCLQPPRAE